MRLHAKGVGICQWCLPDMGPGCFALAKSLGFDGVQMDMGLNDPKRDLRKADILAAYAKAQREGQVSIPSLALNYLDLIGKSAEADVQAVLDEAIRIAVSLGAGVLQTASFFDGCPKNQDDLERTARLLAFACEQSAPHGIVVGSENQLDLADNLRLLQLVPHDNYAVYFDTANPALFDGRDGVQMLDALAARVCEVHVKDYLLDGSKPCVNLGEGDCAFLPAMDTLARHGYDKWLIVENALGEQALRKDAELLHTLTD